MLNLLQHIEKFKITPTNFVFISQLDAVVFETLAFLQRGAGKILRKGSVGKAAGPVSLGTKTSSGENFMKEDSKAKTRARASSQQLNTDDEGFESSIDDITPLEESQSVLDASLKQSLDEPLAEENEEYGDQEVANGEIEDSRSQDEDVEERENISDDQKFTIGDSEERPRQDEDVKEGENISNEEPSACASEKSLDVSADASNKVENGRTEHACTCPRSEKKSVDIPNESVKTVKNAASVICGLCKDKETLPCKARTAASRRGRKKKKRLCQLFETYGNCDDEACSKNNLGDHGLDTDTNCTCCSQSSGETKQSRREVSKKNAKKETNCTCPQSNKEKGLNKEASKKTKKGRTPVRTFWALTRISVYSDNSKTYEIMRGEQEVKEPTPEEVEGIFVIGPSKR